MPRRTKVKAPPSLEETTSKWRNILSAVELYDFFQNSCPRLANFTKVYVMLKIARLYHGARFLGTPSGRKLFYTFRTRVAFFNDKREDLRMSPCHCTCGMYVPRPMKFMPRCPKRKTDDKQIDQLSIEVRRMRGPHALDLFAFMHLSQHLGNDLALLIFDFC